MHTLLKAWTPVKTLSSLAHNWNSDQQVVFPFFLSLFYCNFFLRRMHTYKCFLKRMASPLQCLAKRHELEGRIGAGWQSATCEAKHPNS